jgi:hypothetical protein
VDSNAPRWSGDVRQADWIGPRLAPWSRENTAATVVPAGFAAYARVLHPVELAADDVRRVRWADVAAWSGLPLRPDAQFHSVALPPTDPGGPPPYSGQGPTDGTLDDLDAEFLAGILRDWTATPDDCWFCVWDGYGWGSGQMLFSTSASAALDEAELAEVAALAMRDPVPAPVRAGPRVALPHRNYLLYQGAVEAASALASLDGTNGQSPNLWWPADRAWCVASEIDLPWTYVGGPQGLIDAILADDRIEAQPAAPDDRVYRVEDWVAAWVDQLLEGVLTHGTATLTTPRGSVRAQLDTSEGLRIYVNGLDGDSSSSWTPLGDPDELRESVRFHLTLAVLGLV